jgi:predicted PurR-regulated permease PerM
MVNIIFSILLFIASGALSFALFKFFLTKKTLKRKKVTYGLVSAMLLIVTFVVGISWMTIDQRIKALPNWQEKIYGNLKIFDNDLLISEDFQESQAILTQTQDLI